MTEVRLAPCGTYGPESCRQALEAVVGELSWVRPGMTVGIKANLVAAMEPAAAATTHPTLLAELTRLLKARGARVIIGDSPGGLYNGAHLHRVYELCGLAEAVEAGAELNENFESREASFPEGAVLHRFSCTAWLEECDAIVNFCKLKTHGMLAMTGAVKNMFGTVPGTLKPQYHVLFPEPRDFASMLIDLQEYWKPVLHLVDAVEAMEGNGPTMGSPRHLGLVLGSENPYALDAVCCGLIGLEPEKLLTHTEAVRRDLLPPYRCSMEWEPYGQQFSVPSAKNTLFLPGKLGAAVTGVLNRAVAPRPTLNPDRCIGCGKCASLCPAKAITMVEHRPRFDRKQCIRCFCCQEFCPGGALSAQRPGLARHLMP